MILWWAMILLLLVHWNRAEMKMHSGRRFFLQFLIFYSFVEFFEIPHFCLWRGKKICILLILLFEELKRFIFILMLIYVVKWGWLKICFILRRLKSVRIQIFFPLQKHKWGILIFVTKNFIQWFWSVVMECCIKQVIVVRIMVSPSSPNFSLFCLFYAPLTSLTISNGFLFQEARAKNMPGNGK